MRTMKTIQSPWRLLIAGGVLCAVWVLIAGADPASWVLGAPAVGLALAGIAILPPAAGPAPHWAALARLVGFSYWKPCAAPSTSAHERSHVSP